MLWGAEARSACPELGVANLQLAAALNPDLAISIMASPSVLVTATEQTKLVRGDDGFISTEGFLAVCRLVLPVVGVHRL